MIEASAVEEGEEIEAILPGNRQKYAKMQRKEEEGDIPTLFNIYRDGWDNDAIRTCWEKAFKSHSIHQENELHEQQTWGNNRDDFIFTPKPNRFPRVSTKLDHMTNDSIAVTSQVVQQQCQQVQVVVKEEGECNEQKDILATNYGISLTQKTTLSTERCQPPIKGQVLNAATMQTNDMIATYDLFHRTDPNHCPHQRLHTTEDSLELPPWATFLSE